MALGIARGFWFAGSALRGAISEVPLADDDMLYDRGRWDESLHARILVTSELLSDLDGSSRQRWFDQLDRKSRRVFGSYGDRVCQR